jgi:hypothetical protein
MGNYALQKAVEALLLRPKPQLGLVPATPSSPKPLLSKAKSIVFAAADIDRQDLQELLTRKLVDAGMPLEGGPVLKLYCSRYDVALAASGAKNWLEGGGKGRAGHYLLGPRYFLPKGIGHVHIFHPFLSKGLESVDAALAGA